MKPTIKITISQDTAEWCKDASAFNNMAANLLESATVQCTALRYHEDGVAALAEDYTTVYTTKDPDTGMETVHGMGVPVSVVPDGDDGLGGKF